MNKAVEFNQIIASAFYQDVIHGLNQEQKSIPCKWFYDETGSTLFEAITKTPEYYPTRVETRLLKEAVKEIATLIPNLTAVLEPGSGSSVKTRILLSSQAQLNTYFPIDISAEFLSDMAQQVQLDFPQIEVKPIVADFTNLNSANLDSANLASSLQLEKNAASMVFFPGSTIGNFSPTDANSLLKSFHQLAGKAGCLLIGVDSTQDEAKLLAAYNDKAGITAQFNKNLLERANRELHADFVIDQFSHQARFNPLECKVEMHLMSRCHQTVTINHQHFKFLEGESIFTESCYKYSKNHFTAMAKDCGWQLAQVWQDQTESQFGLFLLKATFIQF